MGYGVHSEICPSVPATAHVLNINGTAAQAVLETAAFGTQRVLQGIPSQHVGTNNYCSLLLLAIDNLHGSVVLLSLPVYSNI